MRVSHLSGVISTLWLSQALQYNTHSGTSRLVVRNKTMTHMQERVPMREVCGMYLYVGNTGSMFIDN